MTIRSAELFKLLQEWRYAHVVVKMCRKNRKKKDAISEIGPKRTEAFEEFKSNSEPGTT